jgi:LemA protein
MTALRRFGLLAPLASLRLAGCGLNSVPTAEEEVYAKWANVQSEYQRRNDLIGNLVETVKGYAKQEKDVLVGVTEARSRATGTQLSAADLDDPAKVRAYNDAQSQLSSSLNVLRGPTIFEAYPELKSNENFLRLQDELTGTENRIAVSRTDYNEAVRQYNEYIRKFPAVLTAKATGAKPRAYFEVTNAGAREAPKVDFGKPPSK